jgi:hypothetical protein
MQGAGKKIHYRGTENTEETVSFDVTPAKAGVHIPEAEVMGPGFRRGDIEFSTEFRANKADIRRRNDESHRQ